MTSPGKTLHGDNIPVLSLSDFDRDKGGFVRDLDAAYREYGFVGIRDHGIDEQLIADGYDAFARFFALPNEVKKYYHVPGQGGARGYTGFGIEKAKDAEHHDLKEFWHVGRDVSGDHPMADILHENLWPTEVEGFKAKSLAVYEALEGVGNRVLEAIALGLGQPQEYFADKTHYGNSILRAIHYPPVPADAGGSVRAAAHEDINLITLLVGSAQAGLEILNRHGQWVPVTTIEGTIVCNIGDMLQRLCNHVYPSTTHRVVNPPSELATQSRYSMPFFLHANPDFVIKTLPGTATDNNPDRYPEAITANEFLQQRLREINLL
jgi:isopenicillin N synthase-like dioxygenase